jgi:hypothetical protein
MKKLFFIILILSCQISFGQKVTEVERPILSEDYIELIQNLNQIKDSSVLQSIELLENKMESTNNTFEKYKIAQMLTIFYTTINKHDSSVKVWNTLNENDVILPFYKDKVYPSIISAYLNNENFNSFYENNDELRKIANEANEAKYFVKLPTNYSRKKKYPLLIIIHDEINDLYGISKNWVSDKIDNSYITVYTQGRELSGSYSYKYGSLGAEDITKIYKKVAKKYSVDKKKVIIASQYSGSELAINVACNYIKTKGLLLVIPVKPDYFNLEYAAILKKKNVKVNIQCGQKDYEYFEQQIELMSVLDSAEVANSIVIYPNSGHELPNNFPQQIDKSLKFLIEK